MTDTQLALQPAQGAMMIYKFTDGPYAGRHVEVTEEIGRILGTEPRRGRGGGKRGPAPDERATRTPRGAKSRRKREQLDALLRTPAACKRVSQLRRLGVPPDQAAFTALHPMTGHPVGLLRLLGLLSGRQWSAARMLRDAGHALLAPVSSQFEIVTDKIMRVDCGRRIYFGRPVIAETEPDIDDEQSDGGGYLPDLAADDALPDQSLFGQLIAEFQTKGMTPRIAVTIAREAVREECGLAAWRLLDALLLFGGPAPHTETLATLRAALDTVDATLWPSRSVIGATAREIYLMNRCRVLAADFAPVS